MSKIKKINNTPPNPFGLTLHEFGCLERGQISRTIFRPLSHTEGNQKGSIRDMLIAECIEMATRFVKS